VGRHDSNEADEQKRAEMENDRAHESAPGDAALGREKTRPIEAATNNSATSAAEAVPSSM